MSRRIGDPPSKYGYNPDQFDIDVAENLRKYEERLAEISEIVLREIEADTFRQEETFDMFLSVLREWRITKGKDARKAP